MPQIVLENAAAEENDVGDNDALLQEIAESSAKETRTPIFKPTGTNSEGKQRDLQVGVVFIVIWYWKKVLWKRIMIFDMNLESY